ncbi:MAG: acetamidase [Firmicutes bacterium]|nr:acetamidase [Bacillota bacterium]
MSGNQVIYALGEDKAPVAEVQPGELVVFETIDAFGNQIQTEKDLFESADWSTVNPATGPVTVKGAQPGDVLVVDILDIEVADTGVMVAVPGMGALGHIIQESESRILKIEHGFVQFNDAIRLPVDPMIGVIGTAPADEPVPTGTPGHHGGNMDTKEIKKGARLYLPVFKEGALLAMGDFHAVMGDGEVVICGVEVAGRATVRIDLVKAVDLATPIVESKDHWFIIGTGADLDAAARYTLDQTYKFLNDRLPLTKNEICMLMSVIGDLQISQIVDPQITCRMAIAKVHLARYGLRF